MTITESQVRLYLRAEPCRLTGHDLAESWLSQREEIGRLRAGLEEIASDKRMQYRFGHPYVDIAKAALSGAK